MNKYFKLDSRKVSYLEYWNITRSWTVLIPWTAKLLNIPMNFSSGLPYFDTLRELEVPEEQFPARAREKLQSMVDTCQRLGFHSPVNCSFESMHRDTCTSFITMTHASGTAARLTYSVGHKSQPPREQVQAFVLSQLRDGTFLVSTSRRQQFQSAPGVTANRLIGASLEAVIQSHLQKLAELPLSNSANSLNSADDALDTWDRYEKHANDFGFQRGIYVWMNPQEAASEHQHVTEAKTMAAGNEKDVGILIELNKLQNKKASWTGMIILFLVSLVLFVGAGQRRWSMHYLFILVGVLFVHELGHYLAMRAFKYKNLQMFFIPFFGAAVTGSHYNVPGWKKAIVSLMGPLPGIYLGLFVGGLGWYFHEPILTRIAVVSLLLNGSNLIPILPLDGGWVFHSLLFSRHYMLDVVFRALAATALIAAGAWLGLKSLLYVGILTAITLPITYRLVKIAAALKQSGLAPVSEDNQTIPPATAEAIITEIRKAATKPQSNRSIAQQTLRIFEMLNARPPGWSATVGLLFVQCASIAIAGVFVIALLFGPGLGFLRALNKQTPHHKLVLEQSQTWPADYSISPSDAPGPILVATFENSARAMLAFQDFTNQMPSNATLKLFGDSLLLSLPPNRDDLRKDWLSKLQRRTSDSFEDRTNYHAAFSLSCVAPDPDAAKAMVRELNNYFDTLPGEMLVPPWQPDDKRTAGQRAANELARDTWLKLQNLEEDVEDDTNLEALETQFETGQLGGSNVASLQVKMAALKKNLYRENLPKWLSEQDSLDTNIVDLFITLNSDSGTNQELERRQIAERMGRIATAEKRADRFCAQFGNAENADQTVNLHFVSFNCTDEGPPALAIWLRDKGCVNFKYVFVPGFGNESSE